MMVVDVYWTGIRPELILMGTVVIIMVGDLLLKGRKNDLLGYLTAIGMLIGLAFILGEGEGVAAAFKGMIIVDSFTRFLTVLIMGVALVVALMSIQTFTKKVRDAGEYYILVLLATVGMMLMVKGADLIMIFIGMEIIAVAFYFLAGYKKGTAESSEGALKYFLLGTFSAAFFLFGIALFYGATGTTNLEEIARVIVSQGLATHPLVLTGTGFIFVGLGFNAAVVPFHWWAPDAQEGAPTAISAFMAVGAKIAAFAVFARVFGSALSSLDFQWKEVFWVAAVITMIFGNLVALSQTNIKRMLAYSSIAHGGYILVGVIAGGELGWSAVLYYFGAYAFMSLGTFGVVLFYEHGKALKGEISDYAGVGFRYPLVGAAMTIFLFSLAGIPPLGGFMGKFFIFSAAIKSGYIWLTIIGVINSLISVFYYFRVTMIMYMKEPVKEITLEYSVPGMVAVVVALVGTIYLGIAPTFYLEKALDSIQWLIR